MRAPALWRRMAAFVYEGVLLFGLLMISGWLYSTLTQQRHALNGRAGLQAFLFLMLGIYFVWFWSRGGQTVAMRAWNIRLVDAAGQPVTQTRALGRYLLAWLWFAPGLLAVWLAGLHGGGAIYGAMTANVLGFAALAYLRADRQFWHDAVCGTRLVHWSPPKAAKAALAAESGG